MLSIDLILQIFLGLAFSILGILLIKGKSFKNRSVQTLHIVNAALVVLFGILIAFGYLDILDVLFNSSLDFLIQISLGIAMINLGFLLLIRENNANNSFRYHTYEAAFLIIFLGGLILFGYININEVIAAFED